MSLCSGSEVMGLESGHPLSDPACSRWAAQQCPSDMNQRRSFIRLSPRPDVTTVLWLRCFSPPVSHILIWQSAAVGEPYTSVIGGWCALSGPQHHVPPSLCWVGCFQLSIHNMCHKRLCLSCKPLPGALTGHTRHQSAKCSPNPPYNAALKAAPLRCSSCP